MTTTNYSVDDGHGTNLAQGIQSLTRALKIAQDHADKTALACLVYDDEGYTNTVEPGADLDGSKALADASVRAEEERVAAEVPSTMTTMTSVTAEQVSALADEASAAGDEKMYNICQDALEEIRREERGMQERGTGHLGTSALARVVRAIRDAEGADDSSF